MPRTAILFADGIAMATAVTSGGMPRTELGEDGVNIAEGPGRASPARTTEEFTRDLRHRAAVRRCA
jgi:hypothetical protein